MPARSWAGGSRKYTKPSGSLSFRKQAKALPGLTLPPSSGPLPKASHIILQGTRCMHRNGHFSMTSASSILFPTVHYPQSDFFPVPVSSQSYMKLLLLVLRKTISLLTLLGLPAGWLPTAAYTPILQTTGISHSLQEVCYTRPPSLKSLQLTCSQLPRSCVYQSAQNSLSTLLCSIPKTHTLRNATVKAIKCSFMIQFHYHLMSSLLYDNLGSQTG